MNNSDRLLLYNPKTDSVLFDTEHFEIFIEIVNISDLIVAYLMSLSDDLEDLDNLKNTIIEDLNTNYKVFVVPKEENRSLNLESPSMLVYKMSKEKPFDEDIWFNGVDNFSTKEILDVNAEIQFFIYITEKE